MPSVAVAMLCPHRTPQVVANIIIVARSGRATNDRTEIVVFDWEKGRELSQLYVGGLECTCLDASTTRVAATLKEPDSNQVWLGLL